jgi:adenine/guanine phosphoribosyltransferase-like PRPP-binding protein
MIEHPHGFWQELYPPGHFAPVAGGWDRVFPGTLPDGRQIALPIRVLPGDGQQAVASLIVNQASFAVEAALAAAMAEALRPFDPEVVVGVPTLGLTLAAGVARALGHARMVALGTSRKFWYDEALSEPMTSITSPDQAKRVYLDPRMLPLFAGRRVALVDDVASSGRTLAAVLRLLARAGIVPDVAAFAMLQGEGWRAAVAASPTPGLAVRGAMATPRLALGADGHWRAVGG